MLVNGNLRRQVSQRISRSIFLIEIICIHHHKYITPLQSKYPFSRICKMTTPPSLVDRGASSFLAGALLLPKNCPFTPNRCGTYFALHIALFITNLLFYRPKALIYLFKSVAVPTSFFNLIANSDPVNEGGRGGWDVEGFFTGKEESLAGRKLLPGSNFEPAFGCVGDKMW